MGRGNCCVFGKYEGLYYIDNDDIHAFHRTDSGDDPEIRLLRDLNYDDLTNGQWVFDRQDTESEAQYILDGFINDFHKMFPRFSRTKPDHWISRSQRAIMENKLFTICVEDNEWSLAVELLQKEPPWKENYSALQNRHYQRYLKGMEKCLLNWLPSIGTYKCAWTSGTLKREDLVA